MESIKGFASFAVMLAVAAIVLASMVLGACDINFANWTEWALHGSETGISDPIADGVDTSRFTTP